MEYPRRTHRPKKEEENGSPIQFYRIIACLLILGGVLLFRWMYPESVKAFLSQHIATGMDYTEVLNDVGGTLRSFFSGVPRPEDLPQDQSASPSPSGEEDENGKEEPSTPPEEDDIIKSDNLSGSLFIQSALLVNSQYLVPDSKIDIDDTDPVPFGMVKPDGVDYSVYPLSFETDLPVDTVRVTSAFGYRIHPIYGEWMFHYGIDMAEAEGSAIRAFAGGVVQSVGYNDAYGNYIVLSHPDGYTTMYGHCKRILVKEGTEVKLGKAIAEMGTTGLSTGPHLHFELRKGDDRLNPAYYLDIPDDSWAV